MTDTTTIEGGPALISSPRVDPTDLPNRPAPAPRRAVVGVFDHAGWAVLVTVDARGTLLDRRRAQLVADGLPTMPHHHEGQRLPLPEAVALVEKVCRSAREMSAVALASLARDLEVNGVEITAIALRECPALPPTIAERISNYRAMCVADWVMYRQTLAEAAAARGWAVHWYDSKTVINEAAVWGAAAKETALGPPDGSLESLFEAARAKVGPPWQKEHRIAFAAALVAGGSIPR